MSDRIAAELELVRRVHGAAELRTPQNQIVFPGWLVPTGWSESVVELLVGIPPGYPTTPPDNFFVRPSLKLANGQPPGNVSQANLGGETWQQFSYHVKEWAPHADIEKGHNLLAFLEGVRRRLEERS